MDRDRFKDSVGPGRPIPFVLVRTDNASYLWIKLFHLVLDEKGRAGFVMANGPGSGHRCAKKVADEEAHIHGKEAHAKP